MYAYYGAPSLLEQSFLSGAASQKYSQYYVRTFPDSLVFHIETAYCLTLPYILHFISPLAVNDGNCEEYFLYQFYFSKILYEENRNYLPCFILFKALRFLQTDKNNAAQTKRITVFYRKIRTDSTFIVPLSFRAACRYPLCRSNDICSISNLNKEFYK